MKVVIFLAFAIVSWYELYNSYDSNYHVCNSEKWQCWCRML